MTVSTAVSKKERQSDFSLRNAYRSPLSYNKSPEMYIWFWARKTPEKHDSGDTTLCVVCLPLELQAGEMRDTARVVVPLYEHVSTPSLNGPFLPVALDKFRSRCR